jgi:hypothetical protein
VDFFRTPKRVRLKTYNENLQKNGWGGVLVGVHKPPDPRKYFLPRAGLAVPVTAILTIAPGKTQGASVEDVTLSLYNPSERETVDTDGAERPLAADLAAPSGYYPNPFGDRCRGDTPNSSDGVVPYWSSHLDGTQSELIVPGPHGSFALPQTIAELKTDSSPASSDFGSQQPEVRRSRRSRRSRRARPLAAVPRD